MIVATKCGLLLIQPALIKKNVSFKISLMEMEGGFIFTEEIWIEEFLKICFKAYLNCIFKIMCSYFSSDFLPVSYFFDSYKNQVYLKECT